MPAVVVENLRKEFVRSDGRSRLRGRRERVEALKGVSFEIAHGECVAVLGCNGSGKSTLFAVLSTLLLHDGGSARVFGHDVARDARLVRGVVNRVSVEAAFFKRLSAAENLSYAARFYGLTPAATRRRIPEILDAVGFPARRATAPMEDLSRGMQQKVALARALLDLADAAPARRADNGPRPARQARGAGLRRRDAPHARHHHAAVHP